VHSASGESDILHVMIEHARQRAPYTFRWVLHMHDLSSLEGEWRSDTEPLPDLIEKLLQIAGELL